MKNLLQVLLFFSLFHFSAQVSAQKKYALLIGINKYYAGKNVLHKSQLRGCVNDAHAMKGMLIKRFGFEDNDDIILLSDENASRKMVEAAFKTILLKVKPGDAFVFYFSGHGVWMNNMEQNELDKKLKAGMNQALVLSDLYADSLKCLFRDADVKTVFNKFVNKKVVATAIFDCCFSGHLAQGFGMPIHNPYSTFYQRLAEKSLSFSDIILNYQLYHNDISQEDSKWDTIFSSFITDSFSNTKAFNLKDNLQINDSSFITRPSERVHSKFLSISGTDEYQKGEEMRDASGAYHGVFTKALLEVIDNNATNISVKLLFDKVQKSIQKNGFKQTPLRFQDPERLSKNLIGIASQGFKDNIEASIIEIKKNKIIVNAGTDDGLKLGNVLSKNGNKKLVQLQIISIEKNTATARIIQGNATQIKLKDPYVRTNNFSKTNPFLKLYIPLKPITIVAFEKNVQQLVVPLSKLKNYRHYEDWYLLEDYQYLFYNKTGFIKDTVSSNLLKGINKNPFFIFLPLPNSFMNEFKNILKLDQNFELVNNPSKANFVLYLNYTKNGYVFTWAPHIVSENKLPNLYDYHFKVTEVPKNKSERSRLTKNLLEMTTNLAQEYTSMWLNDKMRKL